MKYDTVNTAQNIHTLSGDSILLIGDVTYRVNGSTATPVPPDRVTIDTNTIRVGIGQIDGMAYIDEMAGSENRANRRRKAKLKSQERKRVKKA